MSINEATPEEWDKLKKLHDDAVPEWMNGENCDPVEKPAHYTVGPVEVIDIIRQQQGSAVEFHYEAALLKYALRWRYKNGVQDLKKARVYLDWLIDHKEQGG